MQYVGQFIVDFLTPNLKTVAGRLFVSFWVLWAVANVYILIGMQFTLHERDLILQERARIIAGLPEVVDGKPDGPVPTPNRSEP